MVPRTRGRVLLSSTLEALLRSSSPYCRFLVTKLKIRIATFLQKLAQTLREWCLIAVDCCRGLSFARPPPEVAGWTGVMSDHVRIYKRNIKEECGGTSS
ncbi:hypothetical protein HPP92_026934 [Vanilla planifolia]|uniref:Uncharacterized protein n=1 Tax=Vanilla planifolia TaxID=51239 RepID=A0A835PAK3_VANPL|nr:hypothetical protein HPP92_026934 [Vanilla planifolia]